MQTKKCAVIGILLFTAGVCQANQANPTWGDISRYQAQEILYKSQANAARAREEASRYGGGHLAEQEGSVSTPSGNSAVPIFLGVVGNTATPKATFSFPEGGEFTARVGDTLQGNYRVKSIALNKVMLVNRDGVLIEVLRANSGKVSSNNVSQPEFKTYTQ